MPLRRQPSTRHLRSDSPVPHKPSTSSSQPGALQQKPNSRSASRVRSHAGSQSYHNADTGYGSTRDGENTNQQETQGDQEEECNMNSNSEPESSKSNTQPNQQAGQDSAAVDNKPRPDPLHIGTPGPGTYAIPSCFMSPDKPMNASAYVLASNVGATIKCRNFSPGTDPLSGGCSPGPLAYSPVVEADSCKPTASRAVFGSTRRAQLSKLYMGSAELNKAAAIPTGGPGPGTYRVGCGRSPGRAAPGPPAAPQATFAPPHSAPHTTRRLHSLNLHSLMDELTPEQHAYILGFRSNCNTPRRDAHASARPTTSDPHVVPDTSAMWGSGTSSSVGSSVEATSSRPSKKVASTGGPGGRQHGTAYSTEQGFIGKAGNAWSFGPPSFDEGMRRRRSKEGNVFISNQHAQVDPGEAVAAAIPGPAYNVDGKLQLLSIHRSDGTAGFGKEKKAAAFTAKLYISSEHVKTDPSLSVSPGPGTAAGSLPGGLASPLRGKPVGPRFGSPNRSPTAKAPFISEQHQADLIGRDSPGPACYNSAAAALAGSALGDPRTAHFGTGEREVSSKVKRTFAPGPGAYLGELTKLSTHATPPSFSLGGSRNGSALLGHSSAHATPGVGAYTIALADRQCLPSAGAPSIKGALEHGGITARVCSPGPAAYSPRGFAIGEEANNFEQQQRGALNSSSGSSQRAGSPSRQRAGHSPSRQQRVAGRSAAVRQEGNGMQRWGEQRQPGARLSGQLHQQFLKNSSKRDHLQAGAAQSIAGTTSERSSTAPACSSRVDAGELNSTSASIQCTRYNSMVVQHSGSTSSSNEATSEDTAGVGQDICAAGSASNTNRLPSRACSPRKGFSMYGKCTTPDSGVSPGPAAYAVGEKPVTPYSGSCKLTGRSSQEKLYISKLHEESQVGADSPGPAAYSNASASRFKCLSNHKHGGAFSFGSGSRPEMARVKF